MNIQKHCIKNVEESRQGKKIYLIFTDGSKHPQIQNGLHKNRHGNDYLALKYQLEPGIGDSVRGERIKLHGVCTLD